MTAVIPIFYVIIVSVFSGELKSGDETEASFLYKRVSAFLKFADMIKPGTAANIMASSLSGILKLASVRKTVALNNMKIVFPDKSEEELNRLLSESYESMVWTGMELMAWHKDPSLINKWVVSYEGMEYVDKALKNGRGIIGLSGHIGNWEHAAAWMGYNYGGTGIARHSDSPVQKELISELRAVSGLKILGKEESMTKVISLLRKNGMIGLLSDQHAENEGIKVPFFGKVTGTVVGAAVFAYLTEAPIIPIQSIRIAPFKFKIIIDAPVEWVKLADRESTIRETTIRVNKTLERMILRAPGQWLWQHRRFRELTGD